MHVNKTKFERSNKKDIHWENKMHKSKTGLFAVLMYLQMNAPVQRWPAKSF